MSAGIDAAPDWGFFHRHLTAQGHAWVGRLGPEGGDRRGWLRREHPSEAVGPRALRGARASGRRLVLRHVHPGGRARQTAGRPEPVGRADRATCVGRRRVTVGRLPGHLHQRGRPAHAGLRRLLRARPARHRGLHRRRVHPDEGRAGLRGDHPHDLVERGAHPRGRAGPGAHPAERDGSRHSRWPPGGATRLRTHPGLGDARRSPRRHVHGQRRPARRRHAHSRASGRAAASHPQPHHGTDTDAGELGAAAALRRAGRPVCARALGDRE